MEKILGWTLRISVFLVFLVTFGFATIFVLAYSTTHKNVMDEWASILKEVTKNIFT